MKTIARCELCNGEIEIEENQNGKEVGCPWCASNTLIRFAPHHVNASTPPENKAPLLIEGIRKQSSYPALRGLIRVSFGFIYFFEVFLGFGGIWGAFIAQDTLPIYTRLAFLAAALAGLMIVALVTLAVHQALLILIDIADASIYTVSILQRKPDP